MRPSASGRFAVAGLVAVAGALAGGCFFTGDINERPHANLEKETSGPHYRGDEIVFTAQKSGDPDGDELTAIWAARACEPDGDTCSNTPFATGNQRVQEAFLFIVAETWGDPPRPVEAIRVELTIRDRQDAEQYDSLLVDILNRDPTLQLQVAEPPVASGFPASAPVEVFARFGDPDLSDVPALEIDWSLVPPPAEGVTWELASDTGDEQSYVLTSDAPGQWDVVVTVTDPLGGVTEDTKTLVVQPDAPPCIASTDPPAVPGGNYVVESGEVPRRFALLSVTDDLDPYPAPLDDMDGLFGEATMRWQIATPVTGGAWVDIANHTAADYAVDPAVYEPGDRLELRVEIDDRVGREIVCADDMPTCSIAGDGCVQRVTWGVEIR